MQREFCFSSLLLSENGEKFYPSAGKIVDFVSVFVALGLAVAFKIHDLIGICLGSISTDIHKYKKQKEPLQIHVVCSLMSVVCYH